MHKYTSQMKLFCTELNRSKSLGIHKWVIWGRRQLLSAFGEFLSNWVHKIPSGEFLHSCQHIFSLGCLAHVKEDLHYFLEERSSAGFLCACGAWLQHVCSKDNTNGCLTRSCRILGFGNFIHVGSDYSKTGHHSPPWDQLSDLKRRFRSCLDYCMTPQGSIVSLLAKICSR